MGDLETAAMAFEPLYYGDKLEVVNPVGDIGLVTLWTPLPTAKRVLAQLSPGILDPGKSRIAVIANLYGDGMHQMMCNLLNNPQIRYLVAMGQDLGLPTTAELEAFFAHGLEETKTLGTVVHRVPGTGRVFPPLDGFDPERLQRQVSFTHLGQLSGTEAGPRLAGYLATIPARSAPVAADRLQVTIPPPLPDDYAYRPSDVGAHQVTRPRPLDCWVELVTRAVRFGHPVTLSGGPRLELLNAKVVIADPAEDSAEALDAYGFSLKTFHEYQEKMLDAVLPQDVDYTYGNRLREYFKGAEGPIDTLEAVARELRRDPESRHAYVSLWDTTTDLPGRGRSESATPCLVTVFFRRSQDRLTLTATYRSHNLLTAWLQNIYGLMGLQQEICKRTETPPGPITIVSHSLGIDPRSPRYQLARDMAAKWDRDEDIDRETGKHHLREDPNGYFIVTVDDEAGELVAEHRFEGILVKQYRGDRAAKIERQIIGDMAVSLVSHALWLGRELSEKEARLRKSRTGRTAAADGGEQ